MSNRPKAFMVSVNGFDFAFNPEELASATMIEKSPGEFNLIKNFRSAHVQVLETERTGKKMKVAVEGEIFEVDIKDELDQKLENMGFNANIGKQVKEIKAPMPGLVLSIAVTKGQEVKEGERLLILEAMKMENSLLIHLDATIKRVAVTVGQAVEKGQVLVELE